jgi:invasion protein IalB
MIKFSEATQEDPTCTGNKDEKKSWSVSCTCPSKRRVSVCSLVEGTPEIQYRIADKDRY